MPIPNSWGKGSATNKTSSLTGIFPSALVVNGELEVGTDGIDPPSAQGNPGTTAGSGIYIPFSDLTGLNVAGPQEIANAAIEKPGPAGTDTQKAAQWHAAGGARFMLSVLEGAYAAQQNHTSTDRLANCVVTRTALSVVDEDTLQKTFTVKFKLNHTAQEVEAE